MGECGRSTCPPGFGEWHSDAARLAFAEPSGELRHKLIGNRRNFPEGDRFLVCRSLHPLGCIECGGGQWCDLRKRADKVISGNRLKSIEERLPSGLILDP